jgi:hypothetical protein
MCSLAIASIPEKCARPRSQRFFFLISKIEILKDNPSPVADELLLHNCASLFVVIRSLHIPRLSLALAPHVA